MEKINLYDKLNFDNVDLTAPNIVIKEISEQIEKQTNGYIKGIISNYDGPITSYKTTTGFSGLNTMLRLPETISTKEVDIQKSLGKQGEKLSRYEFYLTTPILTQYRYRICFIQHGIANYPVDIVLEQNIADEVNKRGINSSYNYTCYNRQEFEELIMKVIYSKKVIRIMQELINIYQIHKEDNNNSEISNQSGDEISLDDNNKFQKESEN